MLNVTMTDETAANLKSTSNFASCRTKRLDSWNTNFFYCLNWMVADTVTLHIGMDVIDHSYIFSYDDNKGYTFTIALIYREDSDEWETHS